MISLSQAFWEESLTINKHLSNFLSVTVRTLCWHCGNYGNAPHCLRKVASGGENANSYDKYEVKDEISGSHGDEYEDRCLLGCCAV
jgi:hypothetical protein